MGADLALVVAFNLISPSKLRMMEWALRTRAYSPRVLSLQQVSPSKRSSTLDPFLQGRLIKYVFPPIQLAPSTKGSGCEQEESFVVIGEKVLCEVGKVKGALRDLKDNRDLHKGNLQVVMVTETDHKYPSLGWSKGEEERSEVVVVLYGALTSKKTRAFHELLK
jgi:hypothetical protein